MSKPNWNNAPEWANYLVHCAVNCDWTWWENEPIFCEDCGDWHEQFGQDGRSEEAAPISKKDHFWGIEARPLPF